MHQANLHSLVATIIVSYCDTMPVSSRNRRTLRTVFEDPLRSDVKRRDIETLLRALGADLTEGRGSRLRVHLNGLRAVVHRPHPEPNTDKGALGSLRQFLRQASVEPED